MFNKIQIKNYQSLKNINVELGALTVIVGASDSGKSAFFRALHTLVSNRRGADFITHGEKLCTISADMPNGRIELQRGKGTNDNYYELTENNETKKFTKLSGTVPEEVTKFLKIQPKDSINFASQFDKPYLLDTKEYGPSEVARILGALTNVNLLFEGAREAVRRNNEAKSELKIRTSDLATVTETLNLYTTLEEDRDKVENAERLLGEITQSSSLLETLNGVLESIQEDESNLSRLKETSTIVLPSIDDITSQVSMLNMLIDTLESMRKDESLITSLANILKKEDVDLSVIQKSVRELSSLTKLISDIHEDERVISKTEILLKTLDEEIQTCDTEYHNVLKEEGMCPTCGQKIQN